MIKNSMNNFSFSLAFVSILGYNFFPLYHFQLNWGGKIPKEMYVMRDEKDNNNEDFIDTIIKKGSKIKLEFKCKDAGCALK